MIRSLDHPDSVKTAATNNKDVYGRTHSVDDGDSMETILILSNVS